mgnify:CR=1 FL=1
MEQTKTTQKTRHLSIYDFFEVLQLEYLTAELRKRTYGKLKDREYHAKVMKFKKQKVSDISSRNSLPSIFSCDKTRNYLLAKFHNEHGMPNLTYRDEEEKSRIYQKDRENYFSKGAEVRVFCDSETVVGEIYKVNLEKSIIFVKKRGGDQVVPFHTEYVTRII